MRLAIVIGLIMLASLASALCSASLENVVVGTDSRCPNGVPAEQARVYVGEEYYICGEAYLNGVLLAGGSVSGYEPEIMDSSAPIWNGVFSLQGKANTVKHKFHFIELALSEPCEYMFEPFALEVKNSCLMVPPSNIEAIPNTVKQGQEFTIEVANVRVETIMSLSGLTSPISTVILAGGKWRQSFPHTSCAEIGSCILSFEFTDAKHPLCKASSSLVVEVKAPQLPQEQADEASTPLIAGVLIVIIFGTVGAVLMHRYL